MEGWINGGKDGWMEGWMNEWVDGGRERWGIYGGMDGGMRRWGWHLLSGDHADRVHVY